MLEFWHKRLHNVLRLLHEVFLLLRWLLSLEINHLRLGIVHGLLYHSSILLVEVRFERLTSQLHERSNLLGVISDILFSFLLFPILGSFIFGLKLFNVRCLLLNDLLFLVSEEHFFGWFCTIKHILSLLFALWAREEDWVLETEWTLGHEALVSLISQELVSRRWLLIFLNRRTQKGTAGVILLFSLLRFYNRCVGTNIETIGAILC